MTDAPTFSLPPGMSLGLTVPCHDRFMETVEALSRKVAEFYGFSTSDSPRIAAAVARAVANFMTSTAAGNLDANVEVLFSADDERMTVEIKYRGITPENASRAVARFGEPGPSVPSVRQLAEGVMDQVLLDREAGLPVCRLVRALPPES